MREPKSSTLRNSQKNNSIVFLIKGKEEYPPTLLFLLSERERRFFSSVMVLVLHSGTIKVMDKGKEIGKNFFARSTGCVARDLLGKEIVYRGRRYTIRETEAYLGPEDLASHARFGNRGRSSIMFRDPGIMYVYLIYGMHHMLNFVAHPPGRAGAVLIRSVEDHSGRIIEGPGRVTRVLGVTREFNGVSIGDDARFYLYDTGKSGSISTSERIGVSYAGEWAMEKLRFILN